MEQCDQTLRFSADLEGLLRKILKFLVSKSAKFADFKVLYLVIYEFLTPFLRIWIKTLWSQFLNLCGGE